MTLKSKKALELNSSSLCLAPEMPLWAFIISLSVAADGGATTTASSSIRIVDSPCVAVIDTDFHKSITFDVPDSDFSDGTCVSDETWFDNGNDACSWYLGRAS
jgi:hypothetical protein